MALGNTQSILEEHKYLHEGEVEISERAFNLIIGGMLMLMLGLIGEYIGRIYTDVRARPQYFIEEVIGRTDDDRKA